ncbi:hypothetical protein OHB24_40150 [Kribbella sp. NBC_00482]|uniref:hypothetical protein n=1 Tax=Kribbella sp. NBC_00482 TaxID=2975968 RepID=UPI002E17BA4D
MGIKRPVVLGSAAAVLIAAVAGALLVKGFGPEDPVVPAYTRTATAGEKALLYRAEERLISRCMADHGYRYLDRAQPPAPTAAQREFPYVVDDPSWAKRYGYGLTLAATEQPVEPADGNAAYVNKLSTADQKAYQAALIGSGRQITIDLPAGGRVSVSNKGCVATARKQLYGDLRGWFAASKTIEGLDRVVRRDVRADARYQAAVKDWAACLRRSGVAVEDPGALREELARRTEKLPEADAKRTEVRFAVLEATCANSSSLGKTIHTIEPKHRAAAMAAHTDDQRLLAAYEVAALPRAHEALDRG